MFTSAESNRLGDIFVSKKIAPVVPLDLCFVNKFNLTCCLKWQQKLRRVFLVMMCAPFMIFSFTVAAAVPANTSTTLTAAVAIEAENFTSMSGIGTETTTDAGAGLNVGWIDQGDWMSYNNTTVVIPTTGFYKMTYRVASLNGGGSLALKEVSSGATIGTIGIPKTGSWQAWVNVVENIYLLQGAHSFQLHALAGGFNVNWFKIEPVVTTLPLLIQAENYSAMSGIQTEITTDVGAGFNVGWIDQADWMEYSDVTIPATATYKITYRVSSQKDGGGISLGEGATATTYDSFAIPVTLGWQAWTNVERVITLPAGIHSLRVKAATGGFNLNWFKIESVVVGSSSSSSSSQIVLSSSSSSVVSSTVSSLSSSVTSSKSSVASSVISASANSSASSSALSASSKSSVFSSVNSSVSSSASSSLASSVSSSSAGTTSVTITWTIPTQRANGSVMNLSEIGGYEIRYKLKTDSAFSYVNINDASTNSYKLTLSQGSYDFEIATYDVNGVSSSYIAVL